MEAIERLLDWAMAHGVQLTGIGPKPLPGRGIGIVATRALKAKEDILTVPSSLLRSLGNTPRPIVRKLKGATVHAILSVSLCLETNPEFDIWRAVLPSRDDLATCMPICWPPELQAMLPSTAKSLLAKQQAKFDKDWALVAAAYPDMQRGDFLYAWNLVNSRTFYHTTPRTERKLPKDDHMVLQPVADLFNHSPDGCSVAFDQADFTITTTRAHAPGDELFIRYGPHSNDFLLVEYGFTIGQSNPWDETCLDPYLCPAFSAAQRRRLADAGFWEGYMLDAGTVCYRSQTALRMLCVAPRKWQAVLDGTRDEDQDEDAINAELLKVLRRYEKDIRGRIAEIDRTDAGTDDMRSSLRPRWVQIKDLVVTTISRLQH
ncbi:Ribosomal lysine N-methyltransferase set11 [Tolypocladium ophioglossoides CBS 100239]|uniref:Ribosomal lysine N-methyltransferase set11 n=1 Tax=Tolypocladium ophioglossoides (strain CBS 100239) TaxID=1163406 RepID=A0A0L0MZZ5_TOLOC|nr:Ribosomal lysine N-methyltransferase set11 [Tolypocladium ophioglossoides CBS 100239]